MSQTNLFSGQSLFIKPEKRLGLKFVKKSFSKCSDRKVYKNRVNCFDALDDRKDYDV